MVQQSRLRLLLAVTFVSTAFAQSNLPTQIGAAGPLSTAVPTYPNCAATCLAGATGALPCEETDTRCLCSHQADVRSSVESCLGASNECSPEDTSKAAGYYETVCDALGLDQNGEPSMVIGSSGLATATDIGSIPTASSISSPSRTAASATSSSTSSSAASTDKDDDDDKGLSVATVAGIAAGCAFIAVAIITGLIWLYVKRRDGDDEELESQVKKPGFEAVASSFKTAADKSEKDTEFAMTAIPPRPAPRPQPASRGHDRRPTIAERRQKETRPLHRSPSEAMQTSTYPFPFGDKSAAEASVTSLTLPSSAGKPVSAVVVQRSLSKSQLSDAGSIYSVSSTHSEEAEVVQASEARRSRPTTFYNMYSGGHDGTSSVNLTEQQPMSRGQGSLRKNKFNLQVTTPPPVLPMAGAQPSPNPFTTPPQTRGATNPFTTPGREERSNPFESMGEAMSPVSPQERYNPLAQNPNPQRAEIISGSSFGKFDFEIGDEQQNAGRQPTRSLRDSFFGSLDMGFGKTDKGAR